MRRNFVLVAAAVAVASLLTLTVAAIFSSGINLLTLFSLLVVLVLCIGVVGALSSRK